MKLRAVLFATALLACGNSGSAAVVTSISGGTTFQMPTLQYFGSGPKTFGDGITWSSSAPGSVFGYDQGYNFNENGSWSGPPTMAGLNANIGSMGFTFAQDVEAVGGLINWAKLGNDYQTASISVYNSANVLLETFTLMAAAQNLADPNSFYGFSRSQGDIRSFVLSNAYIGLRNLTVDVADAEAVPEPAAWAMLIAGFGLVGGAMRSARPRSVSQPNFSR